MDTLKHSIDQFTGHAVKRTGRHSLLAQDVMSKHPFVVHAQDRLQTVMHQLVERHHNCAPVVNATGQVIGVLSVDDCIRVLAGESFYQEPTLGLYSVADAMTEAQTCVEPTVDLYEIADAFVTAPIRHLLVMHDDQLMGIVTRSDVLRAMVEHYA